MNIKEIINGIAVIIDDEVDKQDSGIYKIRENIIANNIPVATYSDVPRVCLKIKICTKHMFY